MTAVPEVEGSIPTRTDVCAHHTNIFSVSEKFIQSFKNMQYFKTVVGIIALFLMYI